MTATESAPSTRERARDQTVIGLVVCALLLVMWLVIIPPSGAYFPRAWYPAALGTVLLFSLTVLARGTCAVPRGATRIVLALFGALVAFAFLSIAWSGSTGDAWEAANKLLLPLGVAWIAAMVPWTRGTVALLLGVWSLGVAIFCLTRLGAWLSADDLLRWIDPSSGRFNDPLGYPNASAALPAMALLPAVALSGIRAMPFAVRAAALPVAVFLAEFAIVPQSRGAIVGTAVGLAVLFALSGDRIRLLARIVVIAALVAPAVRPLLDVGDAGIDDQPIAGPLDDAVPVMAITVGIAAVAGVLLALLDLRLRVSDRAERVFALAGVVFVLAGVVGGVAVFHERIGDAATAAWKPGQGPEGGSRLLSVASEERPDYARVSFDLFAERPLAGFGVGNWGREYDARRDLPKHSRYAHNLGLRTMSELGLIGMLLLGAMLVAIATGVLAGWRRLGRAARTLVAGCMGVGAYFLAHGMFDWLEEFPALLLPMIGFTFAALSLTAPPPVPERPRVRRAGAPEPSPWANRLVVAGGVLMILGVALSLAPPYLAVRYQDRARDNQRVSLPAAFDDYDRAADANPVSVAPLLTAGVLAERVNDPARARLAFARALRREPHWFAYLQLALLDAQLGHFGRADANVAAAGKLSRSDPLIAEARRRIARRQRVNPSSLNESARDTALFRRGGVP